MVYFIYFSEIFNKFGNFSVNDSRLHSLTLPTTSLKGLICDIFSSNCLVHFSSSFHLTFRRLGINITPISRKKEDKLSPLEFELQFSKWLC